MDKRKIWFERNEQGELLEKAGNTDAALALYEANMREDSSTIFTYERLAAIYHDRGRTEQAVTALEKAIALQNAIGPTSKLVRLQARLERAKTAPARQREPAGPLKGHGDIHAIPTRGAPKKSKGCLGMLLFVSMSRLGLLSLVGFFL
jgi:tetratricopeptide (TPR) repeat protein